MSLLQNTVVAFVVLIQATSGLKCLSCPDVTHPQSCKQTVTCSAGEICGLEKFISNGGDVRYSLDCVAHGTCLHNGGNTSVRAVQNSGNIRLCSQCCQADLCNSGGCGESSFQDLGTIVCYQCQYKLAHEECTTIESCDADEICYIEETSQSMETYFNSGCRRKTICDALNNPGVAVGRKKRYDLCVHCCGSFLCNKKCGGDPCVDQPECSSLLSNYQVCADSHSASHLCPKSCGLCQTETTTSSASVCTDVSQNCEYMERRFKICQDKMAVEELGCHKTCSLCEPLQTTTHLPITSTDTSGREFVLAFSENHPSYTVYPTLNIVSGGQGHINVTIPFLSIRDTIQITSTLMVYNISSSIVSTAFLKQVKGILIESSVPVYLFALNKESASSDGFNVLPSNQLSTQYIVPSSVPYNRDSDYYSQILIVSEFDDTHVTFTLKITGSFTYNGTVYTDGVNLSVVVNKLETFQIAHSYSLSGTMVTSTKPVAVITGNKCNAFEITACSYLADMIPSLDTYDNVYVIPKPDIQRSKIQIIAGKRNTDVTIDSAIITTQTLRREADIIEMEINSTTVITATKGVLVTQFLFSIRYDPCMMVIPGINQYLSNYTFTSFPGTIGPSFDNYIVVVIRSSELNGLFLDGKKLNQTTSSIIVEKISYDYFVTNISPGFHNMYHEHDVTFGVFVFGGRNNDGYCYAAGKHLNHN